MTALQIPTLIVRDVIVTRNNIASITANDDHLGGEDLDGWDTNRGPTAYH